MMVSAVSSASGDSTNNSPLRSALKGQVLFIDDEDVIREIGSEMIQYLGMNCITAANGLEGIDLFKKNTTSIDLVILDVEMPGLSGEKVFRLLMEIKPEVRVLIASGYSKDYLETKVFKGRIENFIPKPFNLERLAYQIRRLLPSENV